jgi:hypothetical protein
MYICRRVKPIFGNERLEKVGTHLLWYGFVPTAVKQIVGTLIDRGCQMVYFQTKITILGKFWMGLNWKVLVYLMALWSVQWPFGIFYGHLVYFGSVWYFFPVLVYCTNKNLAAL